jgi:hypothetical protein
MGLICKSSCLESNMDILWAVKVVYTTIYDSSIN